MAPFRPNRFRVGRNNGQSLGAVLVILTLLLALAVLAFSLLNYSGPTTINPASKNAQLDAALEPSQRDSTTYQEQQQQDEQKQPLDISIAPGDRVPNIASDVNEVRCCLELSLPLPTILF